MLPFRTNRPTHAARLRAAWWAAVLCTVFHAIGSEFRLAAGEPLETHGIRVVPGAPPSWTAPRRQIGHATLAAPNLAPAHVELETSLDPDPPQISRPNPFDVPGLIAPATGRNRSDWDDPGVVFADGEPEPFRPLDQALPLECLTLDPAVPPGAELTQVSVCDPEGEFQCGLDDPWSRFDEGRSPLNFFGHDLRVGWHVVVDDAKGLFRARNIAFLGLGLGGALGVRQDADVDVREWTAAHPRRWGTGTDILDWMGRPEVHVPIMLSLYGWGMTQEDEDLLRFSRLMIRTYSLTTVSTVLVKAIADTRRPSQRWINGRYGFPSGHASTTFAMAATIEEYYGPQYGLPAYLLAGAVSFSRIDDRDHDLSDVIFGAVLGYTIGKSVAGRELRGDSRIQFFPWTSPADRATGMAVEFNY